MRWTPIAILIAAALAVPSAAAAQPGTIAFHQETFDGTGADLWLARADGSTGAVRLTTPDSAPDPTGCFENCGAGAPDWGPDGRLYFDSSWSPFVHIWSMNPDGTGKRQETFSDGFDGYPSVSPDGRTIVYEYSDDVDPGLNGIYVAPSGGGGGSTRVTVAPPGVLDTNADFSPDGTKIVFQRLVHNDCCGSSVNVSIWVVGIDGRGLHRIVSGGRQWGDPHYSPDGSRILIQSYDESRGRSHGIRSNEFTVRPDGSGMKQLTSGKDEVSFSGDWSPHGSRIVFVHYQFGDDHLEIWTMNADGSNRKPVADCDPDRFCDFPSWGSYSGALPARRASRS